MQVTENARHLEFARDDIDDEPFQTCWRVDSGISYANNKINPCCKLMSLLLTRNLSKRCPCFTLAVISMVVAIFV